jgi:hypothetical protein
MSIDCRSLALFCVLRILDLQEAYIVSEWHDDCLRSRRDVLCGGGAGALTALIAGLLGDTKPVRAQTISGSVPEVDELRAVGHRCLSARCSGAEFHGHYEHFGGLVGFLQKHKSRLKPKLPLYVGGEDCFCSRQWT